MLAAPTFAADLLPLATKAPLFTPQNSWAGWYVGVNAGYGFGGDSVGLTGANAHARHLGCTLLIVFLRL
jgi:hypothetical protein